MLASILNYVWLEKPSYLEKTHMYMYNTNFEYAAKFLYLTKIIVHNKLFIILSPYQYVF